MLAQAFLTPPFVEGTRLRYRRTLAMNLLVTGGVEDRKSTRLNSSHSQISYAVFCLKKKTRHSIDLYVKEILDSSLTTRGRRKPSKVPAHGTSTALGSLPATRCCTLKPVAVAAGSPL